MSITLNEALSAGLIKVADDMLDEFSEMEIGEAVADKDGNILRIDKIKRREVPRSWHEDGELARSEWVSHFLVGGHWVPCTELRRVRWTGPAELSKADGRYSLLAVLYLDGNGSGTSLAEGDDAEAVVKRLEAGISKAGVSDDPDANAYIFAVVEGYKILTWGWRSWHRYKTMPRLHERLALVLQ